ncbi:response regulator transcription factor [Bacterioplanoides sp. SCSIO 12839]|uniref:response regulator transcription factor n=1 Tax=Bacterioplanoides sp. SCSIO 12839 TaxID=2829569 RepID=UPI002104878F|nr:response regulator transcription factor [Bacterioplanoides sp. SCSIO 12839]UTW47952.1 response regulator transcription factor [Bacterioplanoides sp. SCSIO 12839]
MKILIVEDDQLLQQQLVQQLQQTGFDCQAAGDGMEGYFLASEYPFDMAVVDLGLPKIDGIELIRRLRTDGCSFPVLILTARDGWKSRVEGLDAGADDYMEKPFHIEELAARCRALLRRTTGNNNILQDGPLALDLTSQQVSLGGIPMELTAFEYKILEYMMRRSGEVISKNVLTDYLYDQDFERDSNVIEVLIGRLRKKLAAHDNYAPITTLRGRGYQFQKQV